MSICQVCRVVEHKYKCPKCIIKYCSSTCYKTHKCEFSSALQSHSHGIRPTEVVERTPSTSDEGMSQDRVPVQKLELLRCDSKLLECLRNPHLRAIVSSLDATSEPDADVLAAMKEPIFAEFVDNCLRVVEPEESPR